MPFVKVTSDLIFRVSEYWGFIDEVHNRVVNENMDSVSLSEGAWNSNSSSSMECIFDVISLVLKQLTSAFFNDFVVISLVVDAIEHNGSIPALWAYFQVSFKYYIQTL